MAKPRKKLDSTEVRSYRLKTLNIEFLNDMADETRRSSAVELDCILDALRTQKKEK